MLATPPAWPKAHTAIKNVLTAAAAMFRIKISLKHGMHAAVLIAGHTSPLDAETAGIRICLAECCYRVSAPNREQAAM